MKPTDKIGERGFGQAEQRITKDARIVLQSLGDAHRISVASRGEEASYGFVDEDTLLDDFFRDVALILEGKL